jgi:hypothetical protein
LTSSSDTLLQDSDADSYSSSDCLPLNHVWDWEEWNDTGAWLPPPEHVDKMKRKEEQKRARKEEVDKYS